jgi:hypothetical protein
MYIYAYIYRDFWDIYHRDQQTVDLKTFCTNLKEFILTDSKNTDFKDTDFKDTDSKNTDSKYTDLRDTDLKDLDASIGILRKSKMGTQINFRLFMKISDIAVGNNNTDIVTVSNVFRSIPSNMNLFSAVNLIALRIKNNTRAFIPPAPKDAVVWETVKVYIYIYVCICIYI